MKKSLFILILLFIPIISFADSFSGANNTVKSINEITEKFSYPKNAKPVKIFYKTKFVQSMTFAEYKAILLLSQFSAEVQKAEEAGRVKILLHDDPWIIQEGQIFSSKMTITWYNKAGKTLKTLTIKIKLTNNQQNNQIIKIYRDIAAIGFPVTTGTTILLIILLIILL